MARKINIRTLLDTQGSTRTLFGNNLYRDFFSKSASDLLHSSTAKRSLGLASGKETVLRPLLGSGSLSIKGRTFREYYPAAAGLPHADFEVINVRTDAGKNDGFAKHLSALNGKIDQNLWIFIQAMGSHQRRIVQDSFSGHRFASLASASWPSLKNSTRKKRRKLGLWPGRSGILGATGRLQDSITLTPSYDMKKPFVKIFTDPEKFKGAYPEWVGAEKPRKNRGKGKSDVGIVPGMQVNGRAVYGRKDRVYAAIHNEKFIKGAPQRRFMGIIEQLTYAEERLIDDYLFFSVFSSTLGFSTAKKSKSDEKHVKRDEAHRMENERINEMIKKYGSTKINTIDDYDW